MSLQNHAGTISLTGFAPVAANHQVTYTRGGNTETVSWNGTTGLSTLPVTGDWTFQLSRHSLDSLWAPSIPPDTIELPVMRFTPVRPGENTTPEKFSAPDFDDRSWKTVKIRDRFNPDTGCRRYLSDWDAWWISYYESGKHIPEISGGTRYFRKRFTLDTRATKATADMTADRNYVLFVNGKRIGSDDDPQTVEQYDITGELTTGPNEILVEVGNTHGLLLEGSVRTKGGTTLKIRSDSTWQASEDRVTWNTAFLFASPPLGPWGSVPRPGHEIRYPVTVWYRQLLPPGAATLIRPDIRGEGQVFVNGRKVSFDAGGSASLHGLTAAGGNVLAVRITVNNAGDGIINPVKVVCGQAKIPLQPWGNLGLEWYSGRALYSKTVQLNDNLFDRNTRLMLDLGRVNDFAEIWVNDSLVTFRPWPPFRTDITPYLHPGTNRISIVVANLLANQASWDILDANIDNRDARWWHDGTIMREKERLISGLLGPVTIIPLTRKSITLGPSGSPKKTAP